jgi:hypothetical protein
MKLKTSIQKDKMQEAKSSEESNKEEVKELKESDPEDTIKEWRKYFTQDQLVLAYSQINAGIDPNDTEIKEDSDSNPSEDNLTPEEMNNFLSSIPKVMFGW